MSELRRRILGDSSSSPSPTPGRTPSPAEVSRAHPDSPKPDPDNDTVQVPRNKLEQLNQHIRSTSSKRAQLKKTKISKRRYAWIFGLGGLFGVVVAAFFAGSNDMIDLASLMNLNLDSLLDVLPAGVVKDAQELQVFSPSYYTPDHVLSLLFAVDLAGLLVNFCYWWGERDKFYYFALGWMYYTWSYYYLMQYQFYRLVRFALYTYYFGLDLPWLISCLPWWYVNYGIWYALFVLALIRYGAWWLHWQIHVLLAFLNVFVFIVHWLFRRFLVVRRSHDWLCQKIRELTIRWNT